MFLINLERTLFFLLIAYSLLFSWSVALANVPVDFGMLLVLGALFFRRMDIVVDRRWLLFASLFFFSCFLSAFGSAKVLTSLYKTWSISNYTILPFLLGSLIITTNDRRQNIILAIAVSVTVTCVYALCQGIQGLGREGAFLGRQQMLGQFLQVIPLLIMGIARQKWPQGWIRYWFSLLIFAMVAAILFTGIRGALLALTVIGIPLIFVLSGTWKRKILLLLLLILIGTAVITSQVRLQQGLVDGVTLRAQSVTERFLMWRSAWNMFLDHPWLGVGIYNFGDPYEKNYMLPEAKEGRHPHPHNIFLQFLAETGIFGFGTFLLLYGYSLAVLIRNARSANADFWHKAAPLALVSFLVYGLSDNLILDDPGALQFCWFVIGCAWRRT